MAAAVQTNGVPNGTPNGTPKPADTPATSHHGPKDSVMLDASTDLSFLSHNDVPRSDALRQPLASLDSRLQAHLESWSFGPLSQDIDHLLDYAVTRRLKHMPNKGSTWDTILRQLIAFTSMVHHYEEAVAATLSESAHAASIIYSCVHVLLELGPTHADSLSSTAAVLYSLSTLLTFFLRHGTSFKATVYVQQALANVFINLTMLLVDLTVYHVEGGSGKEIQVRFGQTITSLESHKNILVDEIWRIELGQTQGTAGIAYSVDQIRHYLSPFDHTVALLARSTGSRKARAEFTCEWFDSHLMTFMRGKDRNLLISGKSGSGKSMLADWIIDHLQRPRGTKSTDVIWYKIQPDLVSETSSASVAKGLLLQLLDLNIGNFELLKALNVTLDMASLGSSAADIEESLWRVVSESFNHKYQATIIIDGLDHLTEGQRAATKVVEKLQLITSARNNVKAIFLSAPLAQTPENLRVFSLEPSLVQGDIRLLVRSTINSSSQLSSLTSDERAKIVEQVAVPADGSFVWAEVTLATMLRQHTIPAILKSLETAARGLDLALERLVFSRDLHNTDTKELLAWMLAAERPLHIGEIKALFQLDTDEVHHAHSHRLSKIEDNVRNSIGDIAVVQDGYVRFAHTSIREYLTKLARSVTDLSNKGKFPFHLEEAHYDVATRCMAYLKTSFDRLAEPSARPLSVEFVNDLFRDDPLLEYCTRYWNTHVEQSPMYQKDGNHKLSPAFKQSFTTSVFLAQMERTCWEQQYPSTHLMQMYTAALALRKSVIGSREAAVLQNMINIASLHTKLNDKKEATDAFYQAYELSLEVFGPSSRVTTGCAIEFINTAQTTKFMTRNDESVRLEKTLLHLIDALKVTEHTSKEISIKYSTTLAELYASIKEEDKAIPLWRSVYEMSAEAFGSFDAETIKIYKTLVTTLKKNNRIEELAKVQRFAYDRARRSLAVTDARRHELAIELTQLYEQQNKSTAVEEIIVDEWQSLTKAAATSHDVDLHNKKLDLSLQYAQFLRKHEREAEAQNILSGTWSEYKEHTELKSEHTLSTFTLMAQEMRKLQMVETAHSVLLTVWNETKVSTFSSTERTTLTQTIATELLETTQHVVNTKREITDSDMSVEETIMEDITQTVSASSTSEQNQTQKSNVTNSATCDSLSNFYLSQGRWVDAIRVCSKFLENSWPQVLKDKHTGKLFLPLKMQTEVSAMATRLADSQFEAGETAQAEQTLQNIFEASKNSLSFTDTKLISAATNLTKFLESTRQYGKALHVHDELYAKVKVEAGPASEPAMHAAYGCAKYCLEHNLRKEAEKYYLDVYVNLGKNSEILPEETIEAVKWLEDFYRHENRWKEAQPLYQKLWHTVVTRGKQYGITAKYIDGLYSSYASALKTHYEAPYEVIRQVTVQFRDTALAVAGENDEVTIRSAYELAKVSEQNEKHREEAMKLYSWIQSHVEKKASSTALSFKLVTVYRETKTKIAQSHTSSTTTIKKAVAIFVNEYQTSASQLGHSHKFTLEQQRQLVTTLAKENTTESSRHLLQTLETSAIDIVATEKDSRRLSESATHIAKSYIETGNVEAANALLTKLRHQLIFDQYTKDEKSRLDRSNHTSLGFVAAFERALYPERQFSEIMSGLMTESVRYEVYHKAIQDKESLVMVVLRGQQLLEYLQLRQRKEEYAHVRNDLFKHFKSYLGVQVSDEITQIFFDVVISHLGNAGKSTIIHEVVSRVTTSIHLGKFKEAYELALLESAFMDIQPEELSTTTRVEQGLKLALQLTGRVSKRTDDADLSVQMLNLSKKILALVLKASRTQRINISSMSLDEINSFAVLLGSLHMYYDLEAALNELWHSRHVQRTWSPLVIVTLGRRLVEVRFAAGRKNDAIRLCEEIIYNLRRVWGELDATTLSFWSLLAELHSAGGDFFAAQNVHEEVLRHTITGVHDGDVTPKDGAEIAVRHLELLKAAYGRSYGWSHDSKMYANLQAQLREEFGKEGVWARNASAKQDIAKWSKEAPKKPHGIWQQPPSWDFVIAEDSAHHRNNLRKISGLTLSTHEVKGGVPRGGKSYGSEITSTKVNVKSS